MPTRWEKNPRCQWDSSSLLQLPSPPVLSLCWFCNLSFVVSTTKRDHEEARIYCPSWRKIFSNGDRNRHGLGKDIVTVFHRLKKGHIRINRTPQERLNCFSNDISEVHGENFPDEIKPCGIPMERWLSKQNYSIDTGKRKVWRRLEN